MVDAVDMGSDRRREVVGSLDEFGQAGCVEV